MHLFQELAKLYDENIDIVGQPKQKFLYKDKKTNENVYKTVTLQPIHHITLSSYIEFVLDTDGNIIDVVLEKKVITAPSTTESANRSANISPHSLHENLNYVAKDISEYTTKNYSKNYTNYITQLTNWVDYCEQNGVECSKLKVVKSFVENTNIIAELIGRNILGVDENNKLLKKNPDDEAKQCRIFNEIKFQGDIEKLAVRFNVKDTNAPQDTEIWLDKDYYDAHIQYQNSLNTTIGICQITGEETALLANHPKRIRGVADATKIISVPSNSNHITYQGRFGNKPENTFTISMEISLKAHAMLAYMVAKQGIRIDTRYYVVWSTFKGENGVFEPPSALQFNEDDIFATAFEESNHPSVETNEQLNRKFGNLLRGEETDIDGETKILVLDSTIETKGRLSILEYNTISNQQYLSRFKEWEQLFKVETFDVASNSYVLKAPTIYQFAKGFNREFDEAEAYKRIISSLMSTLINGSHIPKDILSKFEMKSANYYSHTYNKDFMETIRLTSSLLKANYLKREGELFMTLNKDISDRSYLFGRLIAVAEHLELVAQKMQSKNAGSTHAIRNFQRFRTNPESTWTNIQTMLQPYNSKLSGGSKSYFDSLFTEIMSKLKPEDFSNAQLDGKYILGYYHQKTDFFKPKNTQNTQTAVDAETMEEN